MQISLQKLKLIHVARKQLCMDDDTYRILLANVFNKTSSKELTPKEANQLIELFKQRGFQIKRKTGGVSRGMYRKIYALRREVTWQRPDGYERWIKKWFGFDRPRNNKDAIKVIEGLKNMASRAQQ
jgi:hypothetical protein